VSCLYVTACGEMGTAIRRVFVKLQIQLQADKNNRHFTGRSRYRGANKFLARPTSRCILFEGENTSFDANIVIYINTVYSRI